MNPRPLALIIFTAGLLAVTGCAASAGGEQPAAAAQAAAGEGYGEADVRFSREMIPHHLQTMELAKLAEGRSADPYIADLAKRIIVNEGEDIEKMQKWLAEWGTPMPPTDGPNKGHHMDGGITAGEMAAVAKASGAQFDRLWLRTLHRQLEHGVDMAETVLAEGQHAPTTLMAGQMITDQREEIQKIGNRLGQ